MVLALLACGLAGCAPTSAVTRGGGERIAEVQRLPAVASGRYRVAVGAIIDKTDPASDHALARQLDALNAARPGEPPLARSAITSGVRDMLATELFGSGAFIVVERAALDEVLAEQEFAAGAAASAQTRLPPSALEGAELLVLGAITAFDAGVGGAALPVPIPLGRHGDFGVFWLRAKRGFVAMDLRVIDCRSGRVLNTTAVEGSHWRFGMDFSAYVNARHDVIELPGLLRYFSNTPVERALQDMVTAAVGEIVRRATPLH